MRYIAMIVFFLVSSLVLVACGGAGATDPDSASIDTMDLPYSWQANLVEGTDYDDSQPPGPTGLPEHVQVNPGDDKETNWLPEPAGTFSLYIRAYWGKEAILDGSWMPPKIEMVE